MAPDGWAVRGANSVSNAVDDGDSDVLRPRPSHRMTPLERAREEKLDAFLSQDDDLIDRSNYCRVVTAKLHDDQQLKSLLFKQFDSIDRKGRGVVNEKQVKQALHKILRRQIKKLTDGDSDDEDNLIGGMHMFVEGQYERDTIQ